VSVNSGAIRPPADRHVKPAQVLGGRREEIPWREVARKRAAVGGTTLLTAQWWPWFTFRLDRRVPADAFRPCPSVDAGLLVIDRRPEPLVLAADLGRYQRFAATVFNGPGRGVREVLVRQGLARGDVRRWARENAVGPNALPRDLDARAWVHAYGMTVQ
jgi:23S rRNA (adenine-N6)-dimethyltransferase